MFFVVVWSGGQGECLHKEDLAQCNLLHDKAGVVDISSLETSKRPSEQHPKQHGLQVQACEEIEESLELYDGVRDEKDEIVDERKILVPPERARKRRYPPLLLESEGET